MQRVCRPGASQVTSWSYVVFFTWMCLNVTKATEQVQAFVSGQMPKGTFSVQVGRQGRTPNRGFRKLDPPLNLSWLQDGLIASWKRSGDSRLREIKLECSQKQLFHGT